jgi:hypothetical protein
MRAGIIFIEYKGRKHREGKPPLIKTLRHFLKYPGPDNFTKL